MAKSDKEIILELTIRKENLEKGIVKLESTIKKAKDANEDYSMSFKKVELAEIKLATVSAKLEKSQKGLANTVVASTKKMTQVKDATGSATAATMELSRVVSDAPYGIRGMANNITQLVSQLGTASTKAGGLTAALKLMWQSMMGPLGIVFAITAVVSAIDFFYGANTKAKKSVSDLTKEVYASSLVSKQYVDELESVNTSEERRKVITQELIKLVPTLKEEDLEYGKNLDEVRLKIKQYTLAQASRMEMDKLVQENSELLSKQMRIDLINSTKNQEERVGAIKELLKEEGIELEKAVNQSYQMGQANLTLRKKTNDELIEDFKTLASEIKKESDPILEQINRLSKGLALDPNKSKKGNGKSKISIFKEPKEFNKDLENYLKQVRDAVKREELLNADNNLAKTLIQERYHIEDLKTKHKQNKEKYKQQRAAYKLELKAYLDAQVAKDLISKSEAEGKLGGFDFDTIVDLEASDKGFNVLLKKWGKFYDAKKALEALKLIPKDKDGNVENPMQNEIEGLSFYIDQYKQLMGSVSDFVQAESDRQLTIEQNKTNVLNEELNNRLLNENLSKDQRKSIQQQILQNDEKLRIKQNAIKKKAFNTQKAFNLSLAVVNTISAGIAAANETYGGPVAKLSAMVAVIGAGMAQVAVIARQKFQPESASTPINGGAGSGGGGGTGDRSFNFNLVGASQQNQLLSAIQAKFETPLKAFVVSKDITTQQELDVNIKGTATL